VRQSKKLSCPYINCSNGSSSSDLYLDGKNASLGMGILQRSDNRCADLIDLVFSSSYLCEILELIYQLLSVLPLYTYIVSSKAVVLVRLSGPHISGI